MGSLNHRFSGPRTRYTRSITADSFRVEQDMSFLEKNIRLKIKQVKLKTPEKKIRGDVHEQQESFPSKSFLPSLNKQMNGGSRLYFRKTTDCLSI